MLAFHFDLAFDRRSGLLEHSAERVYAGVTAPSENGAALTRGVGMARYNVLFLCAGNSARSIIAEALLNYWGRDRFQAFSAGSQPKGEVHPLTIKVLENNCLSTANLRSKSWDEFSAAGGVRLDFVFTVCDGAAKELCPVWPGQPMTAHWGIVDPTAAGGSAEDRERAFMRAFRELDARIKIFTSLRLDALDQMTLQRQLDSIGSRGAEAPS